MNLNSLFIFLIFLLKRKCVLSFNLQTKLPTILKPLISQVDLEHPINFGVSLLTLTNKQQNQTILLAGAPAADLGDHTERPGLAFNCDINEFNDFKLSNETKLNEINCKPIKMSNLIKNQNKPIIINDFMQLGCSLSSSLNGKFTICAAGALNLNFKDHYPNGQCWFGNSSLLINSKDDLYNEFDDNELNNLINLNPLNETKRQIFENTYFYSHGMFGFSSKISNDDSQTIFYGAPGFHEWRGAVIQIKLFKNGQRTTNLYKHDYGPYIYFGFSLTLAHLFSDKKLFCVVSAPKARQTGAVFIFRPSSANRIDIIKEVKINKIKTFFGTKNGEYFGCALEAIDLNNDGMDDIIIGAPYYSISNKELMDNGAIYIYLNNDNDFDEAILLFGSGETNSMFGYSIASASDLDQDGYQDFVVGAPYEDDSGCIYIYNGGRQIPVKHSQKICAKQFQQSYKGFGIKIHGLFDSDSNNYPDLAIGAYLSKNVMILKSRPVANLNTQIHLNITSINLNDKSAFCLNQRNGQKTFCFELILCQYLNIKHSQYLDDQMLTTTLQLDVFKLANLVNYSIYTQSTSSRAYFELNSLYQPKYKNFFSTNSSTTSNTITFNSKLKLNSLICHDPFLIMLRNDIEDKLKPIHLTATHRFTKKPDCIKNCPILLNEDQQFIESINFHTGCKQIKCLSNLNLRMNLQTQQNYDNLNSTELIELKQLLIGFHQYAILNVKITNQGEQAYSTYLELNLNIAKLQIKKIESRCKSRYQFNDPSILESLESNSKNRTTNEVKITNYLEILCNLGNPLEKGNSLDLQFVFDLFNTELDEQQFKINGTLHTTSSLTSDSKIFENLIIPLRRQVNIGLKDTQQSSNNILFDFKYKNSSNDKILFSNHLQMLKTGFSNIPLLELIVDIPVNYTNLTLIHSVNIESLDGSSLPCDQIKFDPFELISESEILYRQSNKNNLKNIIEFNGTELNLSTDDNNDDNNEPEESTDFFVQTNEENKFYSNGQFNFNCQTMNCTKFKCSLQSIGFGKQNRLFKLIGFIDLNNMDLLLNQLAITNLSQIKLRTDLKLTVPDSLIDLYQELDDIALENPSVLTALHSIYTIIKQIPNESEKITFWITISSIMIGLFMLFILIIVLIKCGFFRRTKREELSRLKQKQRETLLLIPSAITPAMLKIPIPPNELINELNCNLKK